MATDNPHQNVTFPSNGHQAHGYLVTPESGSGPGLIVIQEWWGLTDHIADVSNRFAAEGFTVLAPDLFGGHTTHDSGEAGRMMQELPVEQAVRDLSGGVDWLLGQDAVTSGKVGVVGYCMGGGFAVQLGARKGGQVGATVAYYGVIQGDVPDLSGIGGPVQGHYAEDDEYAPADKARALGEAIREQAGVDAEIFVYAGTGHAFFNDENLLGTYDAGAAATAWSRTLDFLKANVS